MNAEFTLRRQTEAAKRLVATLRADGAEADGELVADTVEGETGLHEAIEAALAEIDECEVIATGATAKAKMFSERASSAEARAERIRAMVEQALVAVELAGPMRLPGATLSLSRRAPALVIADEAEIPTRFFVEQPRPAPKLDKRALAEAVRSLAPDETIPGASLDNGSIGLLVRRK